MQEISTEACLKKKENQKQNIEEQICKHNKKLKNKPK